MESCPHPITFIFFNYYCTKSCPILTFRQKWKLGGHNSVFYGNVINPEIFFQFLNSCKKNNTFLSELGLL